MMFRPARAARTSSLALGAVADAVEAQGAVGWVFFGLAAGVFEPISDPVSVVIP
jgi:hypothetical protein